jgi:hypothetical protein
MIPSTRAASPRRFSWIDMAGARSICSQTRSAAARPVRIRAARPYAVSGNSVRAGTIRCGSRGPVRAEAIRRGSTVQTGRRASPSSASGPCGCRGRLGGGSRFGRRAGVVLLVVLSGCRKDREDRSYNQQDPKARNPVDSHECSFPFCAAPREPESEAHWSHEVPATERRRPCRRQKSPSSRRS